MGCALLWHMPRILTNPLLCVRDSVIHIIDTKMNKTTLGFDSLVGQIQLIIINTATCTNSGGCVGEGRGKETRRTGRNLYFY